jgi:VanZ family protein
MPLFARAIYDFPGGDRVGHFVLYGILAFLLASAFPRAVRLGLVSVPGVILVLLAFAALEEYSQTFFSTRTADLVDLVFSILGILVGGWLAILRNK